MTLCLSVGFTAMSTTSFQPHSAANTLAANPNHLGAGGHFRSDYKKSHAFDYRHGAPFERDRNARSPSRSSPDVSIRLVAPKPPVTIRGMSAYGNILADGLDDAVSEDGRSFRGMDGRDSSMSMVSDYTLSYGLEALDNDKLVKNDDGRFVPAFVALDRKVLRFHVWFRDPRAAVGFKIRQATLFHYLEDGSTRVSEKRVENSGIVTGEVACRHRAPKPGSNGEFYTVEDFDVGVEVVIFGRTYNIIDMDDFTREFYELNGISRGEPLPMPSDYVEPSTTAGVSEGSGWGGWRQ